LKFSIDDAFAAGGLVVVGADAAFVVASPAVDPDAFPKKLIMEPFAAGLAAVFEVVSLVLVEGAGEVNEAGEEAVGALEADFNPGVDPERPSAL
jgi:hypothetical protein